MYTIITGATKGLGRAMAEAFAAQGHHLIVCARRELDLLDMQKTWAEQYPASQLHYQVCDVSSKHQLLEFAKFALEVSGHKIDVLINNAGVYLPGTVHEPAVADPLTTMIETNLYSAYHLTQMVLPGMLPHKLGHIFNICSVASLIILPNSGLYCISKFALLGYSKALREELKTRGIKVTSVMPGAAWSDSWQV